MCFSVFIFIYFGYNWISSSSPNVTTYVTQLNNDYLQDLKYDMLVMITMNKEFSKMTIPVKTKLKCSLGSCFQEIYEKAIYRDCNQQDLDLLNVSFSSDSNLAHVCINYLENIKNITELLTPNYITWVNCSEITNTNLEYKD